MTTTSDSAGQLKATRQFRAPRALVLRMWSEPDLLNHWFGPVGFSITTYEMDFRPGGVWRFTMHGPDGTDYPNYVRYVSTGPDRIEFEQGTDPGNIMHRTVVELRELNPRTTEMDFQMTFASAEIHRLAMEEYGAVQGLLDTMSRLEKLLEKPPLVINRTFDAPIDLVWQAWTESQHLAKWWGPKEWDLTVVKLDVRPGGIFLYSMDRGGKESMWGKFVYREIDPPHRLVYTSSFSDENGGVTRAPFFDDFPLEFLNVVTLREQGGKTHMMLVVEPQTEEPGEIDRFVSIFGSMNHGYTGTLDKLEEHLRTLS